MPAKKKLIEQVAEVMATGAEPPATVAPPSGTRVVTDTDLAADREFVASLDDAADGRPPAAAADLGDVAADMSEAVAAEDQTGTHEPAAGPARGSINAMVKDLLADPDLSYGAIVDQVMAAHPGARTTARSVASTASVMRRKGSLVPKRQGTNQVKPL
jgi:hypothetical protein